MHDSPYQTRHAGAARTVAGCCAAIFWAGAIGFGYPGVMSAYWQESFGATSGETGLVVTIMLLAISVCTFFSGKFLGRFGMRSCILVGTVLVVAAMAVLMAASGMAQVYVWAFVVNLGASFIYGPGLTTVQIQMPHRKGLASGLLNLVFGTSAAIMSPVWEAMLETPGLGYASVNASLVVCVVVTDAVAMLLVGSPSAATGDTVDDRTGCADAGDNTTAPTMAEKASPAASVPQASPSPSLTVSQASLPPSLTVSQALRTRAFWLIWLSWAFVGAAGISMVSLSKSYAVYLGFSSVAVLMAFNLTNGIGRLVAGWLCDRIGGERTAASAFAIMSVAYALLPAAGNAGSLVAVSVLAACVGYGFGALFATTGPIATGYFGMENFSSIFGLIFTGYGCVGGVIGPLLAGNVLASGVANPYGTVFGYLAVFALLGAFYMVVLKKAPSKVMREKAGD